MSYIHFEECYILNLEFYFGLCTLYIQHKINKHEYKKKKMLYCALAPVNNKETKKKLFFLCSFFLFRNKSLPHTHTHTHTEIDLQKITFTLYL